MATSITGQGIAAYKAPDDALSSDSKNAVQNKIIDGELSDVKNALSDLNNVLGYVPLSAYNKTSGNINSSLKWANTNAASQKHIVVPISPSDNISIKANASGLTYAVLRDYVTPVLNADALLSTAAGFTGRLSINGDQTATFIAPSDAKYLYMYILVSNVDRMPVSCIINEVNYVKTLTQNYVKTVSEVNTIKADTETNSNNIESNFETMGFDAYYEELVENRGVISSQLKWTNVNTVTVYSHKAIPVKPGDEIDIKGTLSEIAFLKSYSTPVNDQSANLSEETGYTNIIQIYNSELTFSYITPSDANYLYIKTVAGGTASTIGNIYVNKVNIKNNIIENIESIVNPAKTVNWCAMGDSITYGYYSEFDVGGGASSHTANKEEIAWAFLVANKNNWRLTNIAVGGQGYIDSGGGYVVARSTDFSPYNLVTLAYGINDWKGNVQMGDFNDDPSATSITGFIPAMRATIEAIMTSNPACKIIVILPLNCNGYEHSYGTKATNWAVNYDIANTGTLKEFVEVMKEICELYGIQYIDMTLGSCINSQNLETLLPDGVHPSSAAHSLLANELSKKITF